jgi:hypothetical protein
MIRFPIYFVNKDCKKVAFLTKEFSPDGTPRYYTNPKCKENTYSFWYCMSSWKPVYKLKKGDIVKWKKYTLLVRKALVGKELIECVGVQDGRETIYWRHWLDFHDVELLEESRL